nr:14316_t:CDS:2 [Entrophospora candida]
MVDYKDIKLRQSMWHTVKDHVRRVAKQLVQDEATYMEQLADFQEWYIEEVYTSMEKLYQLYFRLATQEDEAYERSEADINDILQKFTA